MLNDLSLSKFKSKIADIARPNRFEVIITPPSVYKYNSNHHDMLTWLAQSATIPQRNQGEITIPYHGMELKLPGDYAKENITIGFLNSYGWEGRSFFEKWMEGIQQTNVYNFKTYSSDVLEGSELVVNQLSHTSRIVSGYKFYDIFPISISAIDLNMASVDQIETFSVTFAYSYFENISTFV